MTTIRMALAALFCTLIAPVAALAQAGDWNLNGPALESILDGTVDLDDDSFRMVLVTGSHTPNQSTDAAWSAISANEVSGTGYTADGVALTQTLSRSGLAVTFDCDDQSWASSTITATYAYIVHDADGNGALAASDIPIWYVELNNGSPISTTNGTLSITINASGVYTITAGTAS